MVPPQNIPRNIFLEGADELIYNDVVASLYGRNHLKEIIEVAATNIFVPLTVGGGVRSLKDVESILRSGGDKISINTAAVRSPNLIDEIVNEFGSQVLVLSVEAARMDSSWRVFTDNGREQTDLYVQDWVKQACDRGIGEILLTSIDQEGTTAGFDLALLEAVSNSVSVPVIASGGFGSLNDGLQALKIPNISAIAVAHCLHYNIYSLPEIRRFLLQNGVNLRNV